MSTSDSAGQEATAPLATPASIEGLGLGDGFFAVFEEVAGRGETADEAADSVLMILPPTVCSRCTRR